MILLLKLFKKHKYKKNIYILNKQTNKQTINKRLNNQIEKQNKTKKRNQ